MTIEFWWRQIFEILMIHKPSRETPDVPRKIWARSVQPFWRFLDTNRQTDRQTDKPNLYIDFGNRKRQDNCLFDNLEIICYCSTRRASVKCFSRTPLKLIWPFRCWTDDYSAKESWPFKLGTVELSKNFINSLFC